MSAVALQYESLSAYDGRCSYIAPNEDVLHIRSLIKGKRIQKAAAICSGGEVGLFALLPTVKKELVLIDHSYRPLCYAILKYLLVCEYGWTKAKELLSDKSNVKERKACLEAVSKHIPDEFHKPQSYPYARTTLVGNAVERLTTEIPLRGCAIPALWGHEDLQSLGRRFARKLDKVRFVHGDMQALEKHGPFDLFYISNAHECHNGNRTTPLMDKIHAVMRPGGHIISAGPVRHFPKWKEIEKKQRTRYENRLPGDIGWTYHLYKVKEA